MRTIFKGSLFDILAVETFDESGAARSFEYISTRDVVRVYAITPCKTKMYVIKEKPPGLEDLQVRVVSGGIEPSESAEQAAIRELEEECGIRCSSAERFHTSWQSSKILNPIQYFVAWDCKIVASTNKEYFEDIETVLEDLTAINDSIYNNFFHEDSVSFGFVKLIKAYNLLNNL